MVEQTSEKVNTKENEKKQITRNQKTAFNLALSKAFGDAGCVKQSEKVLTCAMGLRMKIDLTQPELPQDVSGVMVCENACVKSQFVVPKSCNVRGCPYCARKEQKRRVAKFAIIVQHSESLNPSHGYQWRLWTFGTNISLYDDNVIEKMLKLRRVVVDAFDELLSDGWRNRQGLAVVPEFGTDGARLHFHVVQYGAYLNVGIVRDLWRDLSGIENAHMHVKLVPRGIKDPKSIVNYVSKYQSAGSLKLFESVMEQEFAYDKLAQRLVVEYKVFENRRTYITYGIFRSVVVENQKARCKECDGFMMMVWARDWELYIETGHVSWTDLDLCDFLSLYMGNNSSNKSEKNDKPSQLRLFEMAIVDI